MIALYLAAGVCLGLNNGLANTLINWLYTGRNGTATREQVASLHPQAFKIWSALIPPKPLPSPPTCALRVCPCASAVGPWVNLINASFGLGASSAPLLFVAIEHSVGNGLVAFSVIGALAAVPGLAASLLASPNAPPQKMDDVALAPVKAGAAGGLTLLAVLSPPSSTFNDSDDKEAGTLVLRSFSSNDVRVILIVNVLEDRPTTLRHCGSFFVRRRRLVPFV